MSEQDQPVETESETTVSAAAVSDGAYTLIVADFATPRPPGRPTRR